MPKSRQGHRQRAVHSTEHVGARPGVSGVSGGLCPAPRPSPPLTAFPGQQPQAVTAASWLALWACGHTQPCTGGSLCHLSQLSHFLACPLRVAQVLSGLTVCTAPPPLCPGANHAPFQ